MTSGDFKEIANTGVYITDIAVAPDGTIYAISPRSLFKIDLSSGTAITVASLDAVLYAGHSGVSFANGFDISDAGVATVSYYDNSVIVDVNLTSGAVTRTNAPSSLYQGSAGDIWYDTSQGFPVYYVTTTSGTVVEYRRTVVNGVPTGTEVVYQSTFTGSAEISGLIGTPTGVTGVSDFGLIGFDGNRAIDLGVPGGIYGPGVIASFTGIGTITGASLYSSRLDSYRFGSAAADSLTGTFESETLLGRGGNDALDGAAGNDGIFGGGADDLLTGGRGNDRIDGGDGTDTANFAGTLAATVNLSLTTAQNTGHGTDTILNVEHISSGSGNDRLTGNALANSITSGAGNDMLNGAAGNDTLAGGTGFDTMTGGSGSDSFVFNTALGSGNVDRITDFNALADTIQLDGATFARLAEGNLSASAFASNTSGNAADASDRVIYERDTGRLYYDADGTGAAVKVHFATLSTDLSLTSADFFVL